MLIIEQQFLDQILNHLQDCYPLEGCGLLAGDTAGKVTAVYPIDNILHSPTAYKMDPQQQLQAMLDLEAKGGRLSAIYHSHPIGPETPSKIDIKQAYYPEALMMIVSLKKRNEPTVRVFQILGSLIAEKKIRVV